MTNMVAMVLSGSCERVEEIRITESVDCSTYESAGTQIAMGFSQDPTTPGLAESVRRESEVFAESAAMMADALGVRLDRMTFDVTFTAATGDSDLGFMTIPAGTVGGVMGFHRGWVGERNVVSVGFNWTMGTHVTPPKPLAHGHVIQVFGVPNMRTVLHCLPPEGWAEPGVMGLGMIYTALPVTNAIPYVVASRPLFATPEAARASGRPIVYVQGNIHGGEVEGKESAQNLLRAIARGQHADWMKTMVLLVAPIYNADGNERFALDNRGPQNGPLGGQGQRPNAQGLDLNRDHMKLDSPEARIARTVLLGEGPGGRPDARDG